MKGARTENEGGVGDEGVWLSGSLLAAPLWLPLVGVKGTFDEAIGVVPLMALLRLLR